MVIDFIAVELNNSKEDKNLFYEWPYQHLNVAMI
jgi:hypothetical protein